MYVYVYVVYSQYVVCMYEGIQGKMKVNKNEERNEGINLRMENDNMKEEMKKGRQEE